MEIMLADLSSVDLYYHKSAQHERMQRIIY
jgi:hypothetical protein